MVIFGQNEVVWYPFFPLKSWKNFPKGPLRLEKKSFWYFFDHQWSERSCFKKIIQNFFSSRKVTFGHFFEKIFCPRWQVENSTMTLKFWALRSKGVKTSLGARITLVMTDSQEPLKFKMNNPLSRIRHRRGRMCSRNLLFISDKWLYKLVNSNIVLWNLLFTINHDDS